MLPKTIVLSDETFHQTFFSSYKAFINLSDNFINIAILDSVRKKFIYLASEHSNIQWDYLSVIEILKKYHITNQIPDIRLIISNQSVHILPESFQLNDEKNELFKFVFGSESSDEIFTCKSEYDTLIQFSINQYIKQIISEMPQIKLYHHAHALIRLSSWMDKKYNYNSSIYIHIYQKYFEVVAKNNNQLILFNTYTFQNNDDVLYYLHWLIKNLNIDTKKNIFILSGWIDKKNDLIKKMKEFNFSIEWAKFNPQYIYSYRFNELQSHQFATLFSLPYENY
ncbi:MAG: DUF3822 family protein [Bacteroidales bacterium]